MHVLLTAIMMITVSLSVFELLRRVNREEQEATSSSSATTASTEQEREHVSHYQQARS